MKCSRRNGVPARCARHGHVAWTVNAGDTSRDPQSGAGEAPTEAAAMAIVAIPTKVYNCELRGQCNQPDDYLELWR